MKFSKIKRLKDFCESLRSQPNWREVVEHWGEDDFEVDNVRFIDTDYIDKIMQDELASDEYILGCFNPSFLSNILGVRESVIKDIQEAEAFEAIGRWIIDGGHLEELQQEYAGCDGYGHHFNYYDSSEWEIEFNGTCYHVFDNK